MWFHDYRQKMLILDFEANSSCPENCTFLRVFEIFFPTKFKYHSTSTCNNVNPAHSSRPHFCGDFVFTKIGFFFQKKVQKVLFVANNKEREVLLKNHQNDKKKAKIKMIFSSPRERELLPKRDTTKRNCQKTKKICQTGTQQRKFFRKLKKICTASHKPSLS